MRRPNHASRFEGIAKTNVQASRASDTEILQSQVNKAAKKRLSLNGLEILHGRLSRPAPHHHRRVRWVRLAGDDLSEPLGHRPRDYRHSLEWSSLLRSCAT